MSPRFGQLWQRGRHWAGLDVHVLATLLFRGWSVLAGAATMLLLPWFLTPTEQGYYYAFGSVLALQVFFELGLNQIVLQVVSHEMARLDRHLDGSLAGPHEAIERLASLTRLLKRWYFIAACAFVLLVGAGGAGFFVHKGGLALEAWLGAWLLLVGVTGVNLVFSPALAMLEGSGDVGPVARLRLMQAAIGYALMWALLALGARLWVVAAVPLVTALSTAIWLRSQGRMLGWLSDQPRVVPEPLHWRRDLLPLQWRMALSWMSGYFIFYLFTPVLFASQGAVVAGQVGMALSLFAALTNVGMSWVNAKTPDFTRLIAQGQRTELDRLFRAVARRSTMFIALVSGLVLLAVWVMREIPVRGVDRLADLPVLACLAVVTIANSMVFSAAAYMRAHREEPMLIVSLVGALLVGSAVVLGADRSSLFVMASYAAITVGVTLPWSLHLYRGYRRRPA